MSWGWWAVRCKRKTLFLGRSWLLKFTKTSSSCRLNKNNIVIGLRTNQESMLWVFDVGARRGSTARHSHMHPSTTWRVKSNGRAVANAEMPWQVRVTNTENIWSQLKRLMMVETNMTHCCNFSPTPNHSSTFWTRKAIQKAEHVSSKALWVWQRRHLCLFINVWIIKDQLSQDPKSENKMGFCGRSPRICNKTWQSFRHPTRNGTKQEAQRIKEGQGYWTTRRRTWWRGVCRASSDDRRSIRDLGIQSETRCCTRASHPRWHWNSCSQHKDFMFVPQRERHPVHPDDQARQHLQQHLRPHLHNPRERRTSRRQANRRHLPNRAVPPRPTQGGPQSLLLQEVHVNTSTSRDVRGGFPFIIVKLSIRNSRQQRSNRRSRRRRRAGSHRNF